MSAEFNLQKLIRAVVDESDDADPVVVAKLVRDRIRRTERDAALEQALPHLVRAQFRRGAPTFLPQTPASSHDVADAQEGGAVGGSNTSRKVAGIREAWRAVLRQRIAVGDESYKLIADCTVADLEAAAVAREEHARQTMARAVQLRALAGLLAEHGVETVGELPDESVRPVIEQVAA